MGEKSVLIVSQYFWPENMRINDLAKGLIKKGYTVTVLTGRPNYPAGVIYPEYLNNPESFNNFEGVEIIRIPMLARGKTSISLVMNYFSFFISATIFGLWRLRGKKIDNVFVYAVSPIMQAIPAVIVGKVKKAPVFIWVLDLWPETLRAVGVVKHPYLLKILGKMVSWIYNRADYILFQSRSFLPEISKYCTKKIPPSRLIYYPSWAEDDFSFSDETESSILCGHESAFNIVFAGNIGESQDFSAILDAAELLRDRLDIHWIIVGDGRMAEWAHKQVIERNLQKTFYLKGRFPLEQMPSLFSKAGALLVSLKSNDVFERTIPGKVQAYLASGAPLLAMINGEAANVINEAKAGYVCPSGDSLQLANIVCKLAALPDPERKLMGISGRDYYLKNFKKDKLFDQLEEYFQASSARWN